MAPTLIIYAHPARKGHNAYFLQQTEKWLKKNKQEYELIDLYEKGYNPLLQKQEHLSHGKPRISIETKSYQHKIKKADNLIFIYPIWWGAMPAILKGFFERVFTAKFAFTYEKLPFSVFGMKAKPVGLLQGKNAVVFMTTGSQRWTQRLFLRDTYNFSAKKVILGFCGIRTKVYTLGGCGDPLCKDKKRKIEKMVKKGLSRLF